MEQNSKQTIAEKEKQILKFWQENKIFQKILDKKSKDNFTFYDGPPFATGLPHYGHILAGTIKDVIPRYQTMKGKKVRRKWGWDCHGLPIENIIEKELALNSKKDIEDFGIGEFNKKAENAVLKYEKEWKQVVPRMGRFIDMDDSYKTMDWKYTESIWWAFKELYDKKLIYEGHKSMHICPRCETTLSNFEVAQGYKDIKDISVTVKFELKNEPKTYLLAWTTTPWTLAGNVAVAVNPDIDYVKVKDENENYIVAKERLGIIFKDKQCQIMEEFKGRDLVGKSYIPPFDYYLNKEIKNKENAWKIYGADYVTTENGTGIVHLAPAFGAEDMALAEKYNIPLIHHVDISGRFKEDVKDFAGQQVKPKDDSQKTDIEIIKYLAGKNLLFSKEKITHSYPHCWRCDTPLLNYASNSWFVKVTALKDKLLKANKNVNWIPESIKDGRFGNWLEGARDWAISRSRFWGAPLPVWKCDKCSEKKIIGSIHDLKSNLERKNEYILMRHGESQSNVDNIISSRVDDDNHLVEEGEKDVQKTVQQLKRRKIDMIFASDFVRTKETAEIVAKEIGIEEIKYDKRLREVDTGDYHGKKWEEYHFFKNCSDGQKCSGETLLELRKRVAEFLFEIDKKYKNKKILIVSHGLPLALMKAMGNGDITNGSYPEVSSKERLHTAEFCDFSFNNYPHDTNFKLNLHKPYIDDINFTCNCGGEMERVTEVFDCWFESGSMPYAQFHYPFENKKEFKNNFPADFVAEGLDQTRGWFYSLLVLSVGLFGKSPYKNVVVNGLILAEDGKKMSKRLQNYTDPLNLVDLYGADALRFYMLYSPVVHGEDLSFSDKGVSEIYKKLILRLQNVQTFYNTYKTDEKVKEKIKSDNILDRWILARLYGLNREVSENMEKYELDKAVRPIMSFVDDLSTWYLRRSRDRFKIGNEKDKQQALNTTGFVLLQLAKIMSPFTPFVAEDIYKNLNVKDEKESIHLESWTKSQRLSGKEKKILHKMASTRKIVSLGLEARAEAGIKVRQPLSSIKFGTLGKEIKGDKEFLILITDELNIKNTEYSVELGEKIELNTEIDSVLREEGQFRELIRSVQDFRKKSGLTPSDRIDLKIHTDEVGKKMIQKSERELKNVSLLNSIEFADSLEGKEVKIDDMKFVFVIKRQ